MAELDAHVLDAAFRDGVFEEFFDDRVVTVSYIAKNIHHREAFPLAWSISHSITLTIAFALFGVDRPPY
jgi:hypothetical protein